jgi:hypothetical protein
MGIDARTFVLPAGAEAPQTSMVCKLLRRTGGAKGPRPCGVSQDKPMAASSCWKHAFGMTRLLDATASRCALFLALGLSWLINVPSIYEFTA